MQAAANRSAVSAKSNSSPSRTSYPWAPRLVETIGHLRLNPSAIFTRVPAPVWIGMIIADQVAISSAGFAIHPSVSTSVSPLARESAPWPISRNRIPGMAWRMAGHDFFRTTECLRYSAP